VNTSIIGFVFDCKDADTLADFYVNLLGWEKKFSGGGWAGIHTPQGIVIAFQTVDEYIPPIWPWKMGEQLPMAHIDFKVDDLAEAVEHALRCGARKSEVQYFETSTVMFDPEGHPFCLSAVHQ
jgi:catechol 2,3-dioxygenase-like lactoylglutathione lyase family enzyme